MNISHRSCCVILAAGLGTRFGGQKLQAEFRGKTLYARTMDIIPLGVPTVVVAHTEDILTAARERGFTAVCNERPEDGISVSIRRGIAALPECTGALFLVADQPLLQKATLERIIAAGEAQNRIIVPQQEDGAAGNPCYFPARFFGELSSLQGDRGGKAVVRAHPEETVYLPVSALELADTDSREALAELEKRISGTLS